MQLKVFDSSHCCIYSTNAKHNRKVANCFLVRTMMSLYLVTIFLQFRVESITIVMTIAPKQYLITFKLQLLGTEKLSCNYNVNCMRKCNKLYSITLLKLFCS